MSATATTKLSQVARRELIKDAREAARAGNHARAAQMFAVVGITYHHYPATEGN